MEHWSRHFLNRDNNGWLFLALIAWLVYICLTSAQHVPWRDEVRALSIARAGPFWELPKLLHNEGHPALWYFLLNIAHGVFGSTDISFVVEHGINCSIMAAGKKMVAEIGVVIFNTVSFEPGQGKHISSRGSPFNKCHCFAFHICNSPDVALLSNKDMSKVS